MDKPSHEALYRQLGSLVAATPDLSYSALRISTPTDTIVWLGRLCAVVQALDPTDPDFIALRVSSEAIGTGLDLERNARRISVLAHRALARAEMLAPIATQGAFVAAGSEFDGIAALGKILGSATNSVLVVDPYLDETVLTDHAVFIPESVSLSLLGDEAGIGASLRPMAERWIAQYGASRPLAVRAAPARSLHDRLLLIDRDQAWILTQSLKDFAKRAPATIQRSDPEISRMKFEAYSDIWKASTILAGS